MGTLTLPTKNVTIEQAAQLLSDAASPGANEKSRHSNFRWSLNDLLAKINNGMLHGRMPSIGAPVGPEGIDAHDYASIMVLTPDDVATLAKERGIECELTDVTSVQPTAADNDGHVDGLAALVAPTADDVKDEHRGSSDSPSDNPAPLKTSDIAYCFDGIRWSEKEWRKPLGDRRKWLEPCIVIPGQRGVRETLWNPVLIGATLVNNGHAKPRSIRAKFQTKPQLSAWLDTWKTYEADNFDT